MPHPYFEETQNIDPELLRRREEHQRLFGNAGGGSAPVPRAPSPSGQIPLAGGPSSPQPAPHPYLDYLDMQGAAMDASDNMPPRVTPSPPQPGTAQQVIAPRPQPPAQEPELDFFGKMNKNLQDPARRAMMAFSAGMMDTRTRKWQQLDFGTQMSRALNRGLEEYAAATGSTGRLPKIYQRKFFRDKKRWGQQGYQDWNNNQFVPVGEPYPLDKPEKAGKPTTRKFMKDGKTWEEAGEWQDGKWYAMDEPYRVYKSEKEEKASSKAKREGVLGADKDNWNNTLELYQQKRDIDFQQFTDKEDYKQDAMMAKWYEKQGVMKQPKHGDHYSWEQGEHRYFMTYDGFKWNKTKSSKWNPQARRESRLYDMPDQTKMTLGEIISLYKAQRPKEASGLTGFAAATSGGPSAVQAWVAKQGEGGMFGKWLDSIGFSGGLDYLQGREKTGENQSSAIPFSSETELVDGKYYSHPKHGVAVWDADRGEFVLKKKP